MRIVQQHSLRAEKGAGDQSGHAVGTVHGKPQAGKTGNPGAQEIHELALAQHVPQLPISHRWRRQFSGYTAFQFRQACVESDRPCARGGDLKPVVLRRIVRSGNLYRGVVGVPGREAINHGRGGEAQVVRIGTGFDQPTADRVAEFGRG